MAKINELIAQVENPELREQLSEEVSHMDEQKTTGLVTEKHLLALTADYLNVFVARPKDDSADIIKLTGYVTKGITDVPKGFQYSKLLRTYAEGRIYDEDKEYFLKALSPDALLEAFSDGRKHLEYNYRIMEEDGSIHHYAARYSRISNPDEDLRLVVGFRNIDFVADISREKRAEGLYSAYGALSGLFFSLHRVNIQKNTYTDIKTTPTVQRFTIAGSDDYDANAERIISGVSSEWSREAALRFVNRQTLPERMAGKNHISMEFLSYASELCKLHFFKEDEDENGNLCHLIFAVEKVDEEKSQAVINALSRDFQNVFWIDLRDGASRTIKMNSYYGEDVYEKYNQNFFYDKYFHEYLAERVHPEDRAKLEKDTSLEHMREYFKDNDELTGSFRILVNGEVHHYRYTYNKLGNLNSVVAGFRNIDDIIAQHVEEEQSRREKEQAYQNQLKEQLVVFNTLARNFKNVYLVDMEKETAKILKLDSSYVDILKLSGEQVFPFDAVRSYWINNVVCPEDREEVGRVFESENVKRLLSLQKEFSGNYRSIIDGELHNFQYSMSRVDETGMKAVLGYQNVDEIVARHVAQEKKERELEEARLKEAREHSEVISSLSTIYSTIFRADIDTHNYDVLNSVSLMGDVAGKDGNFDDVKEGIINAFMAPEMRGPMRDFLDLNTLAARLKDVNTVSVDYKNPEGRWFQARFIVKRRDENGVAKEVLYVARDITTEKMRELKQQEQLAQALAAAQQANKAKSTFLNSMSHDIRTPMNAIIGFTALAQTHIDDKTQVQDYLAKISTSSTHLLSLINDILDMSRIESGTVKLDEKPVHIPDLLHDLRTMIQGLVNSKNLNLYIDTQDVVHEDVITDKLRLNQVLINIVGNAIKFTQPGGDIMIRLLERPCSIKHHTTYEFSVKDNGIGMSKEFLEHIFESFSREYSSTVSGIQGTGLGMAITKNIVDMMGGEITAESEEGKGSLFTVKLNLLLANEPVKNEPIPALMGARALVVDDDLDTCRSVSKMLRDIKMRPDWTASGKEAIVRAQDAADMKDEYKVYIIDYLMPDMNGIETVRRIRRVISEEVPIIVLTAYDWDDFEYEAKEAGVTAFVSKPLFMSELRKVLTQSEQKETAEPHKEHYDYSGKHVLLVEDNELNREIATAILEGAGIKVDCACDGTEAVDIMYKANEDEYDLIFMDIQMPRMDGYTATHEIRTFANNKKANIPIVAMTANAFDEDRKKSLEAGMNGHIAKPISIKEIAKVLNAIFAVKSAD